MKRKDNPEEWHLSPEDQAVMGLPPGDKPDLVTRQELLRRLIKGISELPEEDKARMRDELDRYLGLKQD